jgi:hypothetical protein
MTDCATRIRRRRQRASNGFATLMAIALVAMAGVAFVAIASMMRHDVRRTRRAVAEAQLRQMLSAGEEAVRSQLDATGGGENGATREVPVPRMTGESEARLTLTVAPVADAGLRVILVEATMDGFHAAQQLRYSRHDGKWTLVAAVLDASTE